MYPAIFLDRDDTLIDDMGYSADPGRVRLRAGAATAIHRLREAGYYIVVVTNQSGVARGYFTEEQLAAAHQRMQELLRAQGTGVDAVYYCPFLPGPEALIEQYRRDSDLRKPKPGMLLQAAEEMSLDLARSWMIGDAGRDVDAGRAAGCRTILLTIAATMRAGAAEFTAPNLGAAVDIILNGHGNAPPEAHDAPSPQLAPDSPDTTGPQAAAVDGADGPAATLAESSTAANEPRATVLMDRGDDVRPRADAPPAHAEPTAPATVTSAGGAGRAEVPAVAEVASPAMSRERALLDAILSELRQWRREARSNDFTASQIVGGIAQSFAAAALFWGLFGLFDDTPAPSRGLELRFLVAMAFQLIALTYLRARR